MSLECTALLRVVSEINRRRVLSVLHARELSVQDLQTILSLGQSTISAHLAQLKLNRLVDSRRDGRFVLYRIASGYHESIDAFIESVIRLSTQEHWYDKDERRVQAFLKQKQEASLSFFGDLKMHNKRSPGQTNFALSIGFMRSIRKKRIIDIGCGSGNLAKKFSELNASVIGIDIEEKQIEMAKKIHKSNETKQRLLFLVADAEDTQQPENSADIVIFSHSLHHIEHPELAIAESYRILDFKGVIIIIDLHKHNQTWMKDIYKDVHLGFEKNSLKEMLASQKFSDIKIDFDSSDAEFPQFETIIATAWK